MRDNATAFNRTSLELKPEVHGQLTVFLRSFNRTSLELKRIVIGLDRHSDNLLIEPVWN